MRESEIRTILTKAFRGWWSRDAFSQSAAAAYYAVFSLPGFLMLVIAVAAMVFEQGEAEALILSHIRTVLGPDVSTNMHTIIESTQRKDRDFWAILIGGFTLFFGGTGLFVQLQKALNRVWEVELRADVGFIDFVKSRVTALGITISLGFLLLVSLSLTAVLTAVSGWMARQFSDYLLYAFYGLNYALSIGIISVLFALIYKVLPDIHLKWSDAIKGGFLAALLFTTGEYGLSFYFRIVQPESTFGAAGSIILFLIWIFYSCLVLLYGAEYIRSHVDYVKGEKPELTDIARRKKAA